MTTIDSRELIKKKLETQRKKLLRYCHYEMCEQPQECPWGHEHCRKRLGLDTAIAWVAGDLIRQILHELSLKDLIVDRNILLYLYQVVQLHANQYSILSQLLKDALSLVDTLITYGSAGEKSDDSY